MELLASKCDACGVQTTRAAQHDENLRRLAARKPQYGNVLMGEEIVALRKRYGLTQQAAAKIFGKGKIAFSRYENEVTYPDDGTTLMLSMVLEKPDSLKWLADRAEVELPLWPERCEDRRMSLRSVPTGDRRVSVVGLVRYQSSAADSAAAGGGWQSIPPTGRSQIGALKSILVPMKEAA